MLLAAVGLLCGAQPSSTTKVFFQKKKIEYKHGSVPRGKNFPIVLFLKEILNTKDVGSKMTIIANSGNIQLCIIGLFCIPTYFENNY